MVEDAVLKAMREWFAEYAIKVSGDGRSQNDNIETALSIYDLMPQAHMLRLSVKAMDWSFIYDLVKDKYS